MASRQPTADEETCILGEQRAKELNRVSSWFILRRTQEVIDKYLPTKQEIVVFCTSTPLQVILINSIFFKSASCLFSHNDHIFFDFDLKGRH